MKDKILLSGLMLIALDTPFLSYADADADSSGSHAAAYVKDSVITTKIKAKLATEHFSSLTQINVDTDKDGAVWLTGSAATQADIDKALSIVRSTAGVTSVKNQITVKPAN